MLTFVAHSHRVTFVSSTQQHSLLPRNFSLFLLCFFRFLRKLHGHFTFADVWLEVVAELAWLRESDWEMSIQSLQTGFCGPKEFHTVSNLEWSSPIGWFPTEKKLPKPLVLRASKPQILTQFEIARQLRCSCLQIWNSQIPSCCPKIFRCA